MSDTKLIRTLVLLGVMGFLLVACGSNDDTTIEVSSDTIAPLPTAIPTTAPILLPPADDTLPALAPLPPTISVAATSPEPISATPQQPADDSTEQLADPVDEASTGATGSTTVVELTDPTEPTELAEPAAAAADPQLVGTTPTSAVVESSDQWSDCVIQAALQTDASVLLDPIAQATSTDLSSVQLNSLAAAAARCDLATANLANTDLADHVATASSCLNAWLGSSGGGSVFVGLFSIGAQQATPGWAQTHTIDALDACFTGASFAGDVMTVVAADPSLAGAFDAACLATSFDSSGSLRTFAQTLVANPAAATLYVTLADPWVLNCANAGQMVAAAAAADGVSLSAASISCIDTELKRAGVLAQIVAGTADTDVVGIATLSCLTDAESSALLG